VVSYITCGQSLRKTQSRFRYVIICGKQFGVVKVPGRLA
jgi:hypothetical protein